MKQSPYYGKPINDLIELYQSKDNDLVQTVD